MRGGDGNRTRVQGFAGPCLSHSATPPRSELRRLTRRLAGVSIHPKPRYRADDGIRTRDPHLGKVMLYQLSHVRMSVRGDLGPVRRISPALRQNFIRSSPNHQLEPGDARKNLSPERLLVSLAPPFTQVRWRTGQSRHSFGMIIRGTGGDPYLAHRLKAARCGVTDRAVVATGRLQRARCRNHPGAWPRVRRNPRCG
jgi:surface antigen